MRALPVEIHDYPRAGSQEWRYDPPRLTMGLRSTWTSYTRLRHTALRLLESIELASDADKALKQSSIYSLAEWSRQIGPLTVRALTIDVRRYCTILADHPLDTLNAAVTYAAGARPSGHGLAFDKAGDLAVPRTRIVPTTDPDRPSIDDAVTSQVALLKQVGIVEEVAVLWDEDENCQVRLSALVLEVFVACPNHTRNRYATVLPSRWFIYLPVVALQDGMSHLPPLYQPVASEYERIQLHTIQLIGAMRRLENSRPALKPMRWYLHLEKDVDGVPCVIVRWPHVANLSVNDADVFLTVPTRRARIAFSGGLVSSPNSRACNSYGVHVKDISDHPAEEPEIRLSPVHESFSVDKWYEMGIKTRPFTRRMMQAVLRDISPLQPSHCFSSQAVVVWEVLKYVDHTQRNADADNVAFRVKMCSSSAFYRVFGSMLTLPQWQDSSPTTPAYPPHLLRTVQVNSGATASTPEVGDPSTVES